MQLCAINFLIAAINVIKKLNHAKALKQTQKSFTDIFVGQSSSARTKKIFIHTHHLSLPD